MGRSKFKIKEEHYPYFITTSVVDGISLFDDPILSNYVLNAIGYLQTNTCVNVYAFVIMHHHVHLIVEGESLSDHVRKFKSFTARKIIDSLKERNRRHLLDKLHQAKHDHHKDSQYQVWQEGFHPKQISDLQMMTQKIEYIHFNPVKADFVELPHHWKNSSARNYLGLEEIIPVTLFTG